MPRVLRRRRTLGPALLAAAALPLAACGAAERSEAEVVDPPATTAPAIPTPIPPPTPGTPQTPGSTPPQDRDAAERGKDIGREAERRGRETGEQWRQYGESRRR